MANISPSSKCDGKPGEPSPTGKHDVYEWQESRKLRSGEYMHFLKCYYCEKTDTQTTPDP